MPELARRALTLQESPIRKLDLLMRQQTGVRFHRLNIGQPDVPTPPEMLEAIRDFQPEVIAYGPSLGQPECRKAAAEYYQKWVPTLTSDQVMVTTGGSEALVFALAATCDPGDEVLVPEPYYTNYNGFATMLGLQVRPIPTALEDGFALPDDATLDALCTPRTRAFLFSNPGNPTGAVYGTDEVARLVKWATRRGVFLISDEVYRRIWFETEPASALEIAGGEEVVIVADSLSKTWSACGLRLGFLVTQNDELMERFHRLGQARLCPQPLAQRAAQAALALPPAYFETVRTEYRRRVDALVGAASTIPGVTLHRPQGAFYAMLSLPVDDTDRFARFLITDFRQDGESLVVAPAGGFYSVPERGKRQIRLAAVVNEDRITRAIELLGRALQQYGTE